VITIGVGLGVAVGGGVAVGSTGVGVVDEATAAVTLASTAEGSWLVAALPFCVPRYAMPAAATRHPTSTIIPLFTP
jgi:hypothetical protein